MASQQLGLRQQLISLFEDDHNDTQLDMSKSEVDEVQEEIGLLDDDPDLISVPEVPTFDPEPDGSNDTQILPSLSIAKNTLAAGADLNPTPPGARPRLRASQPQPQPQPSARSATPSSAEVVSDDTAEIPAQRLDSTSSPIRWGRWVLAIIFLGTLIVAAVVAGSSLR